MIKQLLPSLSQHQFDDGGQLYTHTNVLYNNNVVYQKDIIGKLIVCHKAMIVGNMIHDKHAQTVKPPRRH